MILKALYDLAIREELVPDPDFEIKPVSWVVRVGDRGRFLGIEPLKQAEKIPEGSKKKPKMLGKQMIVPYQGSRTSGDRAFFLVDKSEYTLGLDPKGERETDKLYSRLKMFNDQVEQCWQTTNHSAVQAIFLFLDSLLKKKQEVILPDGCLTNDLFAFSYSLDIYRVHELEEVKKYWKGVCSKTIKDECNGKICLITGHKSLIADKIPLLKNVPGGSTSGVSLVSYNSSAFESYGWEEKTNLPVANAAISSDGALLSMKALNRLLHPNPPDPQDPNQTLSKQNVHLSSDTVVCYWTRNKSALSDSFGLAIEVDEEKVEAKPAQVAEMYKSLWKGIPYELDKPDEFYSLVLSGGQGRATVRDWIESNTQHVVDSLAQYFADLRIERCCPAPKKGKHPESFSLPLLLESLADPKDRRKEGIPSAIGAQFYRASLDKKLLFPQPAFSRAILRYRAELGKERDESKGWFVKNWNDARAAIIKAYLNRKYRKELTQKEVQEKMNPNCTDKGYLLGQLMSVLEKLQTEALGNVNASIIDRCFAGASASPKSVFGSLLRNARHHARKAKDESKNKGQIFNLERLIDQICSQFDVSLKKTEDPKVVYENGFPAYLSQEQQGMFVLGYHQMRKWLWMTREERDIWNGEYSDASRAYLWEKKENNLETSTEEKGENQ
ncbi:MAG: type I-C CRISPR-associated protein Cas8c/Csd1 [Candidatus Omnitrophica bacterium]|nr:type I-C CRISPR-associated protein Cas8c/Csd1 [Candidatus Omnitrophota bacterium]